MSAGNRWITCSAAILCLAALFGTPSVEAAEGGTSPYLKGYKDFLTGIVPPEPGAYIRNDLIYYNGDISRTTIGGRLSIDLRQWFVTDLPAVTVVTPVEILGGTYAFGLAVPILGLNVTAGVGSALGSRSRSDSALNIGNIFVTPAIIGWHAGNFHWNLAFSMAAPTGHYDPSALADTGLNYWSFMPQVGITYFDPQTGWDISAGFTYVINTNNHATDYLTGNIFHLDWAMGKQLTPEWKIGVAGYLMAQVTDDAGSGAILGTNKARVWAMGPAASYTFTVGQTPITVLAKWSQEFGAVRTFQGNTATIAAMFKF